MLELLGNEASPFVRKVRLAARERNVGLRLRTVLVNPVTPHPALKGLAPLARIPVLLSPLGPIYDSRAICRYIDRIGTGPSLYTSERADAWDILRIEALADGIMEAAVALRYETVLRPEEKRWPEWIAAQFGRIDAAAVALDGFVPQLAGPHIGSFAVAAGLEYLDFRHPGHDWRRVAPRLSGWLAEFAQVPAMAATRFRDSAAL